MECLKEEFVKFGENVSVRGVSKIVKSKKTTIKIMWLCAVLGSTGILLWQLVTLFVNYSSYQHKTAYGELTTPNIFPSVTLCSTRQKHFPVDNDFYLTVEEYYVKMINITNASKDLLAIGDDRRSKIRDFYSASIPKHRTNTNDSIPFLVYFGLVDYADAKIYDANCTSLKEEDIHHPLFYDCHFYQIPEYCKLLIKSLDMIIYTNTSYNFQEKYFVYGDSFNTDGVKVQITAPGNVGDISNGFNLDTGTDTLVELSMKVKKILDKPYNSENCVRKKYIDETSNILYNPYDCNIKCLQDATLEKCKCVSVNLPVPAMYSDEEICGKTTLALRNDNSDAETATNQTRRAFQQANFEDDVFNKLEHSCRLECKKPCVQTYYERALHTLYDWPRLSSHLLFFKQFIGYPKRSHRYKINKYFGDYYEIIEKFYDKKITIEQLNTFFKTNDKIRSNFLHVKFVFTSDYPISITDTPAYTWEYLLGSVGGSLSLWMGITIMTFIEVIELLFNLVVVIKNFVIHPKRSVLENLPN